MSNYTNKHVLVTGGAGFVGNNLVRALLEEGAYVIALDDFSTGDRDSYSDYRGSKLHVYDNTVTSLKVMRDMIKQSQIIFHLAARNIIASTKNPLEDYDTNIGGTLNILMAMRDFPVERMVYTSSASVYGNPKYLPINEDDAINLLTPYAVSKYAGEGYCMAFHESYGLPVTVLRLSNVYGPFQSPENPYCGVVAKFMYHSLNGYYALIHGDGLSTRDYTYVGDVVEALLLAGVSPRANGEVFNVATGIETSVEQLAKMIGGKDIVHTDKRDIDNIRRRVLNTEKIRRKLGWTPKTTLEYGLRLTKGWMDEQ